MDQLLCVLLVAVVPSVVAAFSIPTLQGPIDWPTIESNYWNQQPVLIEKGFDVDAQNAWPSLETLRYYIQRYNGRKITNSGPLDSYDLEFGPFDDADLLPEGTDNSEQHHGFYSYILNDVEQYDTNVHDFMRTHFGHLGYLLDDAQISVAGKHGGIGPHVDNYNVFLIQVHGNRTWTIGKRPLSEKRETELLLPGPVSILNVTESDVDCASVTATVGDVLYVPPRYLHWGIADTNHCATLSVGCRTPSTADVMVQISDYLSTSGTSLLGTIRYQSPTLSPSYSATKEAMKSQLRHCLEGVLKNDELFDNLVGTLLTTPLRHAEPFEDDYDESPPPLTADSHSAWQLAPGTSVIPSDCVAGCVYVNGNCYTFNEDDSAVLYAIVNRQRFCIDSMSSRTRQIVRDMVDDGALVAVLEHSSSTTTT